MGAGTEFIPQTQHDFRQVHKPERIEAKTHSDQGQLQPVAGGSRTVQTGKLGYGSEHNHGEVR